MNKIAHFEQLMELGRQAGEAAELLKAMANESRLLILCHLSVSGELSVGQLVDHIGLSQSALSQHLAKLRDERLVVTRKEAQTVYYRLCDPKVEQLLRLLHQLFCPTLGDLDHHHSRKGTSRNG